MLLDKDKTTLEFRPEGSSKGGILLIHGLSGNPSEVSSLAEHLVKLGYHCYVPCLSGHDESLESFKLIVRIVQKI